MEASALRRRIAYFGTFELQEGYPRNRFLIRALEAAGVEVVVCQRTLWRRGERAERPVRSLLLTAPKLISAQRSLAKELEKAGHLDAIVVGYPGHFDLPLAKRLARRRRIPLIFDAFLPLTQTLEDRGRVREGTWVEKLIRSGESRLLRRADHVLIDTEAHADYLAKALRLDRGHVTALPVGSVLPITRDDAERPPGSKTGDLAALFVGTYVPLQGAATIVEAAALLRGSGISFTMVGKGQDYEGVRRLADELRAPVTFLPDWVSETTLDRWIRGADVSLGIFGTTAKAGRVVPCKIYDALARSRPVLTADSPAIRELLVPGESVGVVPAGDASALARLLRHWAESPDVRQRIARGGAKVHEKALTKDEIGRRFRELIDGHVRR